SSTASRIWTSSRTPRTPRTPGTSRTPKTSRTPRPWASVPEPLAARYAGLVCDLDGVVRRGTDAVPYAVAQLTAVSVPIVYATNNASLTPQDVAAQLVR